MKSTALVKRVITFPAAVLRLIQGISRSIYQPSHFGIKRGYRHRTSVIPYDDRGLQDEYQKSVYLIAAELMRAHGLHSIIDMGCGSGYKLIHSLGQYETTGIDVDWMIAANKHQYPDRTWITIDAFNPVTAHTDLIICADVIEHVEDPNRFMQSIISIQNWKYLVLSTPERDRKRGWYHFGPPPNVHHYREWNRRELLSWLSQYVMVESHRMVDGGHATQVVVCKILPFVSAALNDRS